MVGFSSNVFQWGGYYSCEKLTVYPTKVDFELVKLKKTLDQIVADLKKYADLGIYSIEPDQLTPMALSTQGLFGLYHLNEGEGDAAKDSGPNNEERNDGTITNGFWVQGPVTKFLNFDATGYVDCGNEFDVGGLEKLAVGIWASPEAAFDDGNYMIYKDGQFRLQLYSTANLGRFGVKIGGEWYEVITDQAVVDLYGRLFIMGVKTEDSIQIYVNGKLAKEEPVSGAIDASGAHVTLGWNGASGFFHGGLAEAMLWIRKLAAQEVQELYFFPLTRIVRRGQTVPPYPYPLKSLGIKVIDLNEDFDKVSASFKVIDVSGL